MDQNFISFILFFVLPIYLTISLALYILNTIEEKDAIGDYKRAEKFPYSGEWRKKRAVERIKSARKSKREAIIFPVPMVKGAISFFNNDGEQILKKEDQRRAQVEIKEANKVIERARAEVALERAEELRRFEKMLQEK